MGKKNWGWRKDTDWYNRLTSEEEKYKYPCLNCGRKMIIGYRQDKTVCDYCGRTIYKDERAEFRDILGSMLKKAKK